MIPGRGWLGSGGGLPQAGISEATFYNWRKKYAGLLPSEMKRLRQLEEENSKLKRIVADLSLDKAMLQDVLLKKL
jgi:putative transposase